MPGVTKHINKSKLTRFNIFGVVVAVNVAIRVLGWGLVVLPSHCWQQKHQAYGVIYKLKRSDTENFKLKLSNLPPEKSH
jgi:hypothetical protein